MQYFDKDGREIKAGMKLLMEDGSIEMVYDTVDSYLFQEANLILIQIIAVKTRNARMNAFKSIDRDKPYRSDF